MATRMSCLSCIPSASCAVTCRCTPLFPPRRRQSMLAVVLIEIRSVPAERSRGRHNPRVVKRKMSGFPTRSRAAPACGGRFCYDEHIKVLPPAVPEAVDRVPEAPEPPPATPASSAPIFPVAESPPIPDRQHHVRAWRVSGLSRVDYCRQQGLNLPTFNQWVARQRHLFRRKVRNDQLQP